MKKRILSILLAALMLLSAVPLGMVDTAWAISSRDTVVDSGTCGGTLNNSQLMKWTLTSDGTLTISGEGNMFGAPWSQYKSKIKKVVIGEGVESISDNAFHYYENLRSVSLPSTLTSIGEAAFWACSSLQSITLPNNLTNIGLNAFRACHSLTQVLIPASVTSIDGSAFECCTGLTDVVFEGNSLEFGSGATFYDCTSLKNVFFNGTRADWTASRGSSGSVLPAAAQIYYKNDLISSGTCGDNSSGNNTQWKLTKAGTLIITVGTGYTEGGIADFAYGKAPWYQDIYDSGIRCLIIGSGIKTIGSYAFADCTDLAEIIVPDGVISIGNGAFLQNSGAKRVVLPPSTVYIGHGALRDCSALTSVSLPDSMSNRLFLDMFEGCTNLKSVDIPDGITDICEGDLASCPNWTDIYYDNWGRVWNRVVSNVRDSIPDRMNVHFKDNIYDSGSCGENVTWTLTADGTLTISGTGAMTDYTYDSRSPWYSCRAYIKRVVIQQGVRAIGDYAFYYCENLTSVTIPDSVTSIGDYAFAYCVSLTSATIPEGVTSIGGDAFLGCTGLTSVAIPSSVTSTGFETFSGCTGLTSITIPEGVTSIGNYAFKGCSGLTSVTIPDSVTSIGGSAFSGCSGLTSVTIPSSVTSIGWSAFENCTALTFMTIPESVTYISGEVFSNCIRLAKVTIPKSVTSIGKNAFYYCESIADVYYDGTEEDWAKISISEGNEDLLAAALHCKPTPLTAPSVTGGNDSQGRPTLKWDKVAGAAKYEVYRSYSQNGNYSKYSTQTSTGYTNSSYLTSGSTYYYKVRALDANGTAGAWSSIVSVTYKQTLSAPAVTGGNDSQGRPTLKWNAVTGAAKYEVYRARSKDGDYIKYSTQTSTGYTNSAYLTSGSTYYYKVRALDANGTAGAWSSVVSVTYKQTLPAPTVTGGNDAQGRPTLTWNAVTGAAKYEVYRARSRSGEYIKYSTVTGTSYTNTSYIENGNTYYYKVRALDANGTAGAWSSIVSVTYRAASTGTLSAPTVTGGNDSQGRPTLKWNAVSGAAKYEVYRARSKDGDYIKYSTITGTSYTNISYIENGNTYYYKVRALDANGTAGAWGSIVSVTYKQTLPAPTVTGGNDAQGRPTLKWNAVSGAAKYEVYRARSRSGEYIKYSTVTGTSYTNTSYIEDGNTYYYKVRALDASGTAGAWSSIVSVTYRAASTGTLPAPTVTGGNDAQGRPTLTWNAVTGAAKYEVYRARSQSGDYIKYSTVTGTSYTNTSYIEDGNTYYYKVRALDANGTAGAWGSIVSVTYRAASTGTLSAPTVTGGNDAQGRPTLKWKAVTGAAKYEVYRARSLNGDYIKYSTVTGTSYTNTSYIENGNTYYYKVRALKSDGTAGAWSSIVSVTYRKPAAATVASGKCGDSAKWTLDAAGTLTISGSGRMYDYEWPADRGGTTPPWLANKYRDSIRALRVEQGITYIGRCAFDSCSNLSDVTLPTSLRIIGQCAFNDCTALRSIQLPEGLTTIMEDAFNAAGLVSITFPSTLGELRDGAFMNCEKLQSLRLPEGLTTIGNWAFYCNPNISSIYIPASVTTIGEEAFIYYNNLATVRYGGSQSQWSAVSVAANAFPDGVRYVYNVN
ncbi:MAG: leucine-rich repeat protein [Oscillospiraceae bacterium]|nr:leucine-rich repeat protein [Oscillospiraceae bacterium]